MAICKMYGCAPTCGKQLSFCDNGEELFFSTRKCDGFNDCSDGSDEWGCPKKCCSAFTFQGQEYKLGKSNVVPLYSIGYTATCLKIPSADSGCVSLRDSFNKMVLYPNSVKRI